MEEMMSSLSDELENELKTELDKRDENRLSMLKMLKNNEITEVVLDYDGYGDSCGSMDLLFLPGENIENLTSSETEKLYDFLFGYTTIDHDGGHWNNDGAFGEVKWDIKEDQIVLNHSERYINTEDFLEIY